MEGMEGDGGGWIGMEGMEGDGTQMSQSPSPLKNTPL